MSKISKVLSYGIASLGSVHLVAAGCDSAVGDPPPLDKTTTEPEESQEKNTPPELCSPDDLISARLVSANTYIRAKGKPVVHTVNFESHSGERLCVRITTGSLTYTGDVLAPAPASMMVDVDGSLTLAGPSDFDAHPHELTRGIAADALPAGEHALHVELHGKPGGAASVAVFAVSAAPTGSSVGPIWVGRLHDPTLSETFLKDEAIVVFDDTVTTAAAAAAQMQALPFPTVVIGSLDAVPILRVYLPGTTDLEQLTGRIAALGALPSVLHAGKHRIGGISTSKLPTSGDEDYMSYWGQDKLKGAAWHLDRIRAPSAWTDANVETDTPIGVIDSGFNVSHPGWSSDDHSQTNLGSCFLPNKDWVIRPVGCPKVAHQMMYHEPGQAPCEEPPEGGDKDHGTAVAGLLAARGETHVDDMADTLGVVWRAKMHLGRFDQVLVVPDENTVLADEQLMCALPESSDFSILLMAEEMAQAGAQVINMSFVIAAMDDAGKYMNAYAKAADPAAMLTENVEQHRAHWSRFLGHKNYQNLLLVQAAGNHGHLCNDKPSLFCEARGSGYACPLEDTALKKRVLCVGASDADDKVTFYTNYHGDLLAAPGEGISMMGFDGGLITKGGTSLAAPLVAGAAALLRGQHPDMPMTMLHDILVTGGRLSAKRDDRLYRILDLLAATQHADRCRDTDLSEGCPSFTDVAEGAWYYTPVHRLACNCVLSGHPDHTFKPGDPINRAEALKVVFEVAFPGEPFPEPAMNPFPDVPAGEWYAKYAAFGKKMGLVNFLLDGQLLHPSAPMNRGQFVRLLVSAGKASPVEEVQAMYALFEKNLEPDQEYTDVAYDSGVLSDSIYAATNRCVVSGHDGTEQFKPYSTLNRAEASKIGCLSIYGFGSRQCGDDPDAVGACEPKQP